MPRRLSPSAPPLPEAPLIVFDGVCVLCSGFMQAVIDRDASGRFRFTAAQGPLGQALYRDLGLDPARLDTMLLVVDGVAFEKLAAIIEIGWRLGGVWRAAVLLRVLPARLRDWIYDGIAGNRYALFGKRDTCWLPTGDVAEWVL